MKIFDSLRRSTLVAVASVTLATALVVSAFAAFAGATTTTASVTLGTHSLLVTPPTVTVTGTGPPVVIATPPTTVTTSGATFNGSTNPNGGDVLGEDFCYVAGLKLTDCIGSTEVPISPSTLPAAVLAFAVSTAVSGLDQARSYCYQLSATNAVGTSFSTPVCFAVAGSATVTTTTLPNHAPGKVAYTAHFNEDKSTLTTQDVVLCKTVATYMSLHRVRLVSMVGYADPLYTKAYNLVLGQRRALSVEHWILNDLRLMHTPLSATSARSLGATHFVEAGLSNRARALDRRVTIVLS